MQDDTQSENSTSPEHYELNVTVSPEDIDGLGHVNNIVYLRWVQEAASAHWYARATPEQLDQIVWVATRHEIDYLKPAFSGETLVIRTFVGQVTGVRFERFVEIIRAHDGAILAKSRSVWAAVDPVTLRPKRISADLNNRFMI